MESRQERRQEKRGKQRLAGLLSTESSTHLPLAVCPPRCRKPGVLRNRLMLPRNAAHLTRKLIRYAAFFPVPSIEGNGTGEGEDVTSNQPPLRCLLQREWQRCCRRCHRSQQGVNGSHRQDDRRHERDALHADPGTGSGNAAISTCASPPTSTLYNDRRRQQVDSFVMCRSRNGF